MTTEKTAIPDMEILEKDPVMKRAIELTKADVSKTDGLITELLSLCMAKLEDENMDTKHIFMSLAKTMVYMAQTMCTDKEHFDKELSVANSLVIKNLFPALGANAYDEEINKTSEVTFNGEFDEENFNIRRLILIAGALVDYTYWKINFNTSITEQIEKEKQAELDKEQSITE